MIAESSRAAHWGLPNKRRMSQNERILAALRSASRPMFRRELALYTKMDPATVGARCNAMIAAKLIEDLPLAVDPITGRAAKPVALIPKQAGLF